MGWLLRHNWAWALLAFAVGAVITWLLLTRRERTDAKTAPPWQTEEPLKEEALVGAGARTTTPSPPTFLKQPVPPKPAAPPEREPQPEAKREPQREVRPEAKREAEREPRREREQVKPEQQVPEQQVPERQIPERQVPERQVPERPAFSRRMDVAESPAPTLFDDPALEDTTPAPASAVPDEAVAAEAVPVGRYGEGSADAVAHQGPPDGFTIKGNTQSMLFHTPDSPYYGRTKPEVWFRTEADAERAGFSKYVRKPRKTPPPRA